MRPARTCILLSLVALLLVPGSASAQGAGEPEMMDDPVEAMEPEIELVEPAEPALPVELAEPAIDDLAAQGNAVPDAAGAANGAVAETGRAGVAGAAVAPSAGVGSGAGPLPFTGPDTGRLMQLFLVGSVLLSGGFVALAWARARTETA